VPASTVEDQYHMRVGARRVADELQVSVHVIRVHMRSDRAEFEWHAQFRFENSLGVLAAQCEFAFLGLRRSRQQSRLERRLLFGRE